MSTIICSMSWFKDLEVYKDYQSFGTHNKKKICLRLDGGFQVHFNYLRFDPHEVNIKTLDVSLEMRELVHKLFPSCEVVGISPIVNPVLQVVGVEAICEV